MRRLFLIALVLCLNLIFWTRPAEASIPVDEQLKATQACEAFQSLRKRTNPGDITISPGEIYPVIAKNKEDATYYHLRIEDATPSVRWVGIECGELLGMSSQPDNVGDSQTNSSDSKKPAYLLAISWQPAFCEGKPNKEECIEQTKDRFDASNFTLHGLWPQPRGNDYCGVSQTNQKLDQKKKWSQLPPIELSDALMEELEIKMPGLVSSLHLHEWYKHGTCYSETPEEYFRESLDLLDRVNNSAVQELFVENIDNEISSKQIRTKFTEAFGNEAGQRVKVRCRKDDPTSRQIITELQLNLKGEIESDTLIEDLFDEGKKVSQGNRCSTVEVDRVGLN